MAPWRLIVAAAAGRLLAHHAPLVLARKPCDREDRCGDPLFFLWPKCNVCTHDLENDCTYWYKDYDYGECIRCSDNEAYSSPFREISWDTSCSDDSYYDFHGTIFFCQDGDTFGYTLNENDDCGAQRLAPTIRMQAGKRYQMRLVNRAISDEPTNIHTHGLHIPGSGNTDDITREVRPGDCLFYNWTIPVDHMDGTYWYHPHAHKHTANQVDGGAVGVLLIDPPDSANLVAQRPDWVRATENDRHLLLATTLGTDYANGEKLHVMCLTANTWHRLRIVVADSLGFQRNLLLDDTNCVIHHVATDGVWRNTVPKADTENTFRISGATRLDLAVKCSSGGGAIWYRKLSDARTLRARGQQPIVRLRVSGSGSDGDLPVWVPPRPTYLQDLRSAGDQTLETFRIFMKTNKGINNVVYNKEVSLGNFSHNTLQEWTIATSRHHPFHLHLYHMQVVTPGGCGNIFDEGEWYDTISAAGIRKDCVVRFRTGVIGGRTTFHCHVLEHEDRGVMGWVNVDSAPENGVDHILPKQCSVAMECFSPI